MVEINCNSFAVCSCREKVANLNTPPFIEQEDESEIEIQRRQAFNRIRKIQLRFIGWVPTTKVAFRFGKDYNSSLRFGSARVDFQTVFDAMV
jgi:hypothetical protein